MDWALAIETNRAALLRIIAGVLAMAGPLAARLPRDTCFAILRVLRPAESAVRRLILVAAQGLRVTLPPPRPRQLRKNAASPRRPSAAFQLFDPRKRFAHERKRYCPESRAPRVWSVDFEPTPAFVFSTVPPPPPEPDPNSRSALSIFRRLTAIGEALADLPKQAQRLARWHARRARMAKAKFRDALRPGAPPGYRKHPRSEAETVLWECALLARNLPPPNTS